MTEYEIIPCADTAFTVVFGSEIDEETNKRVAAFAEEARRYPQVLEVIPAYVSTTVIFDPIGAGRGKIHRIIARCAAAASSGKQRPGRVISVPVCYGGQYGCDLSDVAEHCKMSEAEVIRLHSLVDYRIYMIGFLPGFPYLGGLDKRLHTPRLPTPRRVVLPGSVGIGGEQTGIYPSASPGGWRLIGRTPLELYNPHRKIPVLFSAGDYLRFVPVDDGEYLALTDKVARGEYVPEVCGR